MVKIAEWNVNFDPYCTSENVKHRNLETRSKQTRKWLVLTSESLKKKRIHKCKLLFVQSVLYMTMFVLCFYTVYKEQYLHKQHWCHSRAQWKFVDKLHPGHPTAIGDNGIQRLRQSNTPPRTLYISCTELKGGLTIHTETRCHIHFYLCNCVCLVPKDALHQ